MSEPLKFADIREALRGTPYKVLDCTRKELLKLPSGALHLWLCYWMHEGHRDESYLSLGKLEQVTGMSRPTIIKWKEYLHQHGWLTATGETAADKYEEPTRGANNVPVVKVDDPTKGGKKNVLGGKECSPPKTFTQGSSSFSCSCSGSIPNQNQTPALSLRDGLGVSSPENQNPNPTPSLDLSVAGAAPPNPPCGDMVVEKKVKCAPDGTVYPKKFDAKTTYNASRIAWVWLHTHPADRKECKYPVEDWLCQGCKGIPDRVVAGYAMWCDTCLQPDARELSARKLRDMPKEERDALYRAKYEDSQKKAARTAYLRSLKEGTPEWEKEMAAIRARRAEWDDDVVDL